MDTKPINSIAACSATATRKMLCGDGVIPLSGVKEFCVAELAQSTTQTLNTLEDGIDEVTAKADSILGATGVFKAIKMKLYRNGAELQNQFGYVILESDAQGNISPSYLTQEEYNALS